MELLVDHWKLPKERLYATYFGGYKDLPPDDEAKEIWLSVGYVLMVFEVLLVIYFLMLNCEQDIHQRPRIVTPPYICKGKGSSPMPHR